MKFFINASEQLCEGMKATVKDILLTVFFRVFSTVL